MLLARIEKEGEAPGARVNFAKEGRSNKLDEMFTKTELKGMMKGKGYKAFATVFPSISSFIDWCHSYGKSTLLTKVLTMYREIIWEVTGKHEDEVRDADELTALDTGVHAFKTFSRETVNAHCDSDLCAYKFHFIGHVVEDIWKFSLLNV